MTNLHMSSFSISVVLLQCKNDNKRSKQTSCLLESNTVEGLRLSQLYLGFSIRPINILNNMVIIKMKFMKKITKVHMVMQVDQD